MKLSEVSIIITTRRLEEEKQNFIYLINSIIDADNIIGDEEFNALLDIYSQITKNYKIENPIFKEYSMLFRI